jgi:hypothetical protein
MIGPYASIIILRNIKNISCVLKNNLNLYVHNLRFVFFNLLVINSYAYDTLQRNTITETITSISH